MVKYVSSLWSILFFCSVYGKKKCLENSFLAFIFLQFFMQKLYFTNIKFGVWGWKKIQDNICWSLEMSARDNFPKMVEISKNLKNCIACREFPALFWKSRKVPWFWKKGPDCIHLCIIFSIQNVVLRVSREKNTKVYPVGSSFLVFLTKYLSNCPSSMKPPMPWKISGCMPVLVLGTCPTPKQDLAMIFWQGDWDACLGMVTDLQSSHSVDMVGS